MVDQSRSLWGLSRGDYDASVEVTVVAQSRRLLWRL